MAHPTPPPKHPIILRSAQPKDVPAIAALGSQVFASSFGFSMPASDLQAYLISAYSVQSVASDLANPNIDIIVACSSSDSVIGFTQLTRGTMEDCLKGSEMPIELQRLYVTQEYHGAGVGRALIDRVEEIARGEGYKTLWLGVWEENFKAQNVYAKMGFRKVGEHDFKMGNCVQTDWILSKRL